MANLPKVNKRFFVGMMTIKLGNFPPESSLILTAQCSQQLDVQDLSYALTVPMAYVPKYMGNVDKFVRTGVTLLSDAPDANALCKFCQIFSSL